MFTTLHLSQSKYFVITRELIFPFLICLMTFLIWFISFKTSVFSLTQIDCRLDYQPCDNVFIQAELAKLQGTNLLELDLEPVRSRLTSADFTIRQATFTKRLPHTLIVDMQSVYPAVALHIPDTPDWVVLDTTDRVIGTRQIDPNVPVVLVDSYPSIQIGQKIEGQELLSALSAAKVIAQELSGVQSVSLSGDTLTIHLQTGKIAYFSVTKNLSEQIRTLQGILSDTTMVKEVKSIDVRFSRPVIK